MIGEIIAVGTEILLGQIVNTNSTFIAQELAALGMDTYYQTVVGDNSERLLAALDLASKRSDIVILCGGLGPTEDDLTKQVVAEYLNVELVEDTEGKKNLLQYFTKTKRPFTKNNLRQILCLDGGISLQNQTGLAVGSFYLNKATQTAYLLLPGPPRELQPMFKYYARPLLQQFTANDAIFTTRLLRFYGIGESQLVTTLDDIIDKQNNPTIAPYAKTNEVTLRITAKTANQAIGEQLVADMCERVLEIVGEYYYGEGEDYSLAQNVVDLLSAQNMTITAAESLTAGLFQSTLGNISGASRVFPGGYVTYSADHKIALGVPVEIINQYGVVSQECAKAMATAARKKAGTTYAIALTGVAGPDELEGNLVGTTWIALATPETVSAVQYVFPKDRQAIRYSAVMAALALIRKEIIQN